MVSRVTDEWHGVAVLYCTVLHCTVLPMRGTASLVMGISSDTMFMKTVRESITVTPATVHALHGGLLISNYISTNI